MGWRVGWVRERGGEKSRKLIEHQKLFFFSFQGKELYFNLANIIFISKLYFNLANIQLIVPYEYSTSKLFSICNK